MEKSSEKGSGKKIAYQKNVKDFVGKSFGGNSRNQYRRRNGRSWKRKMRAAVHS